MPDLRITPNKGLNTDIGPSLLGPEYLSFMYNMEVINGSLRAVRGERKLFDLDIQPLYHTAFVDPQGTQWIIVSNGVSVWAYQIDGTGEDISHSDWLGGVVTFCDLNGVLVCNSETDGLYYWPGTGEVLTQWPGPGDDQRDWLSGSGAPSAGTGADGDYYWRTDTSDWYEKSGGAWSTTTGGVEYGWRWDDGWRTQYIDSYRYYLIALGMTEDEAEYPYKVRWSTSAEEGAIPIQWQILASNEAGSDILGETSGRIIGGKKIRDAYYVVKEDALYSLVWIGGAYVMQLTRLQGTIGTNAPFAFSEFAGSLVVATSTDLLLFDGSRQVSISDNIISRALFNAISEPYWERTRLYFHQPTNTLFVAFVREGAGTLSDAMLFSTDDSAWGHKALTRGYGFDTAYVTLELEGVTFDSVSTDGRTTECDWNSEGLPINCVQTLIEGWVEPTGASLWYAERTIDELYVTYNKGLYQPSVPDTLIYESDGEGGWWVSVLALDYTNSDGTAKECRCERKGLPIEQARGIFLLNELWVEGRGAPWSMSFGYQGTPDGLVNWTAALEIDPNVGLPYDPIVTGRYLAWKIKSLTPDPWVLDAFTLNWEPAGAY